MDPDLWAEYVAATRECQEAHAAVEEAEAVAEAARDRWRRAQGDMAAARDAVHHAAIREAKGELVEEVPA